MLHKVSTSSCSEHCPQTLSMTSQHTLIPIYPYCTAGKTKDLQDNCTAQEDCEELNCETVIHSMAEPKIILHFSETSLWEERAPDSPASNRVLSNRVSISNWGLQTHCCLGFFHFLPILLWLTVAVGSVCTLHRALPPPQKKPSTHRARLPGLHSARHVTAEWPRAHGHPKVMGWLQLSQITSVNTGEQNKDQEVSPGGRQKPKYGTGLGFIPCLSKEIPPHSPLP